MHGKTDGCQTDPENEQISGTRIQKMETEAANGHQRASNGATWVTEDIKGNKRGHSGVPWRDQMEPQRPIRGEKQANMGPTGLQKGVRKGSKSETLEKLKIELPLQRELVSPRKDTPSGPIKLGPLPAAWKRGSKNAPKRHMSPRWSAERPKWRLHWHGGA